jgi:(5-formylfuran-3-yl)methyl phosphate synthase
MHCSSASVVGGQLRAPILVSVRDPKEAASICDLPFEVMDLKEPLAGPLGACTPAVWSECVQNVDFNGLWSVALGAASDARRTSRFVPDQVSFAKVGPEGFAHTSQLRALWDDIQADLSSRTSLVAVAYADHANAACVPPEQVLQAAIDHGISTLLIDTFSKGTGNVFSVLGDARLANLVQTAKQHHCETVVAGGITKQETDRAFHLGARRIGTRGGLCRGTRDGEIDPQLVNDWVNLLFPRESRSPSN